MNRWLRFSGVFGVVVFLFGAIAAFVVGSFTQTLVLVHLFLGIACVVAWFVVAGAKNLGETGAALQGRTARYGYNAALYIVIFVGLIGVIDWFSVKYDRRWDLTQEGVYSISTQSENVIRGIKKPLKLVSFKGIDGLDEERLEDLFKLYRYHNSSNVSYEFIDPRAKPHLIELYEMKAGNLIYMEYGEGEAKGVSRLNESSEEAVTNAIIKLTRGEAKKIYYVQGHDEPDIEGVQADGLKAFSMALGDEQLTLEGIFLAQKPSVPEDAAAVILVSPKKPFRPEERDMLIKHGQEGGRLLLLTDPRTTDDVKQIAASFGIEVADNIIIDQVQRLFAGPTLAAQFGANTYGTHPITKGLKKGDISIFNIASSVKSTAKADDTLTYNDLIKTGPTAWGETKLDLVFVREGGTATRDPDDTQGPVSIAVSYDKKLTADNKSSASTEAEFEKRSRVVVFGDSDWLLNANFQYNTSRDIALNAINWLTGEEGGIAIRPKALKAGSKPVMRETFLQMLVTSFLIIEALLLLGLLVWWGRKTAYA